MNLKDAVLEALNENDESEEDIEQVRVYRKTGFEDMDEDERNSIEGLDVEFDGGFGSESGPRFFVWTSERVYFKQVYDGSESVTSVPRKPSTETPPYVGGG